MVSMEPQIGIRGRRPALARVAQRQQTFQWSPRLVSGEGKDADLELEGAIIEFQWSPRLVSGEGFELRTHDWKDGAVSMEPQIGIRGREIGRSGFGITVRPVSMEPQIGIRGRQRARAATFFALSVSMEPQIGIRGRSPI